MYYYIPFAKDNIDVRNYEEVGIAHPGHLVAVYFRIYQSTGLYTHMFKFSLSDIGATKDYIIQDASYHTFMAEYEAYPMMHWTKPCFIQLDHEIQTSHKVVIEMMTIEEGSNISVKGVFIYEKK